MPHNIKLKTIPVRESNGAIDVPSVSLYPPSFHVNEKQMPEIKNWEVKGIYRLVIEVEQISKHEERKSDDSTSVGGEFNIIKYKYLPEKTIDEMDDKEFEEYQGKELSKKHE